MRTFWQWARSRNGRVILYALALLAFMSGYYYKLAFLNYIPANASDTVQWRGSAQAMIDYKDKTGQPALWDPNVFSGMPGYLINLEKAYPYVDDIKNITDHVINWRVLYLFFAGLGMFLLCLGVGLSPEVSIMMGFAYAFSCHLPGLVEYGHNTKLRAISYMPWIINCALYLRNRRNLLGAGLLSMFMIAQLRESHPQISFYTIIILVFIWVGDLIWQARQKQMPRFLGYTGLLALAAVVTALAASYPYLLVNEYGYYTMRGGETGLSFDYATGWSFHPGEILTFLIPDFFGGISPDYWGWMDFTQTYMFMGATVLVLGLFSFFYFGRNQRREQPVLFWLVTVLWSVILAALLISFGRYFPALTGFLMTYIPGFNKFRVPATTLVIVQVALPLLAGLGLYYIMQKSGQQDFIRRQRKFIYIAMGALALFLAGRPIYSQFTLVKHNDLDRIAQIQSQMDARTDLAAEKRDAINKKIASTRATIMAQLEKSRQANLNKLYGSGIISFVLILAVLGLIELYLRKKMNLAAFYLLMLLMVMVDLLRIDNRILNDLEKKDTTYNQVFKENDIDRQLAADTTLYRVMPVSEFSNNRWSYHHQSAGGYHAAKLQRYQDIIAECLNAGDQGLNTNVLNMLNVKYVIFNDRKSGQPQLVPNPEVLPRAWFVDSTLVLSDKEARLQKLNDPAFNPAHTAIVEAPVEGLTGADSTRTASVTDWQNQELTIKANTAGQALLVVSEVFYPAGWQCTVDGQPTEIIPVNHILRGVVVPAGEHTVKMVFDPPTYHKAKDISLAGGIASILLILVGLGLTLRKKHD